MGLMIRIHGGTDALYVTNQLIISKKYAVGAMELLSGTMNDRGEMGMKDPYKDVFDAITKALNTNIKMILWLAEYTLSAKDFKEFVDEFAKKPKDNHDELLDFIRKEGL